jgi:hypothetical protein
MKIDNHADTICADKNCQIEYYTSYKCSISLFLEDYQDKQNVQIYTALTAAAGFQILVKLSVYVLASAWTSMTR